MGSNLGCCPGQADDVKLGETVDVQAFRSATTSKLVLSSDSLQEDDKDIPFRSEGEADEDEKKKQKSFRGKKREQIVGVSVSEDEIKNYTAPTYPKSDTTIAKLAETLKSNEKMQTLGVSKLPEESLRELVMAFQEKRPEQNEELITQGDEGDSMYIIETGNFDILIARKKEDGSLGSRNQVARFGPGTLFGELAILYDAPRAATVKCASPDALVWALDRKPFQMLLKKCNVEVVEQYNGWLTEIDLFKVLNQFEIGQIADKCETALFEPGEVIVSQGDPGDAFYILEDGSCAAFIDDRKVKTYENQGDYFGELALLNNAPRKATVKALDDTMAMRIEKESFEKLLGPVLDKLRAKESDYR